MVMMDLCFTVCEWVRICDWVFVIIQAGLNQG